MPDDNIDDTNWKYLRYYYQFQILACITTVTDDSNNILLYRCTNAGSRHLELCCPTKLTNKFSMADNTTGLCRLMTASHPIHHHLTTPDNLDSDVIVLFCNNSGDPLVIPTINSQQAQWRSSQHCSTITIIISECPYPSASSMTNNKCTFPYPAAISNITFDTTTQCERLSHHTTHVKTRTMHWKNQTTSWFSRHDLKNRAHANTNHRSLSHRSLKYLNHFDYCRVTAYWTRWHTAVLYHSPICSSPTFNYRFLILILIPHHAGTLLFFKTTHGNKNIFKQQLHNKHQISLTFLSQRTPEIFQQIGSTSETCRRKMTTVFRSSCWTSPTHTIAHTERLKNVTNTADIWYNDTQSHQLHQIIVHGMFIKHHELHGIIHVRWSCTRISSSRLLNIELGTSNFTRSSILKSMGGSYIIYHIYRDYPMVT